MATKILSGILIISVLFTITIFFIFRGYNWPLGTESVEAIGGTGILLCILLGYFLILRKVSKNKLFINDITFGLFAGLLWTIEISMNNVFYPPLPSRDIYDDIFWGTIAGLIFAYSLYQYFQTKKVWEGIKAGLWCGFASGAVACISALVYIVLGMHFILNDPLNITEWSQRGAESHTPNIAVYFAYQTLAGAIMHLVILGIIMGSLLGIVGVIFGKSIIVAKEKIIG